MNNNILSEAGRFIKLINGNQINLDALDNLVNNKSNNSIFLRWEATNGNCNHDSIFTLDEVNILKQQLYEKYCNDNNLSQDDIDTIFGKNENGESNVTSGILENIFSKLVKNDVDKDPNPDPNPDTGEIEKNLLQKGKNPTTNKRFIQIILFNPEIHRKKLLLNLV